MHMEKHLMERQAGKYSRVVEFESIEGFRKGGAGRVPESLQKPAKSRGLRGSGLGGSPTGVNAEDAGPRRRGQRGSRVRQAAAFKSPACRGGSPTPPRSGAEGHRLRERPGGGGGGGGGRNWQREPAPGPPARPSATRGGGGRARRDSRRRGERRRRPPRAPTLRGGGRAAPSPADRGPEAKPLVPMATPRVAAPAGGARHARTRSLEASAAFSVPLGTPAPAASLLNEVLAELLRAYSGQIGLAVVLGLPASPRD
ncbi:unnamed protein product [Rangifer tarandus platyrhynchus]|uniref:Translation initiation factor IF-2-like n=1 Tax=Rangifer tarandus platyrhynchus TaxID=3082113 RepID=A0ABN8YWR0_RANTA|nr:unnamed protein product [Rangifer tarandus platyrhynchus]